MSAKLDVVRLARESDEHAKAEIRRILIEAGETPYRVQARASTWMRYFSERFASLVLEEAAKVCKQYEHEPVDYIVEKILARKP